MLPTEIRTPRLLLRPWGPNDAAAMKEAVDSNLDHLRESVAWARAEPTELPALAARLAAFAAAFSKSVTIRPTEPAALCHVAADGRVRAATEVWTLERSNLSRRKSLGIPPDRA